MLVLKRNLKTLFVLFVLPAMLVHGSYLDGNADNRNKSKLFVSGVKEIIIDGEDIGRQFEGIGAVSAGASSRLLIDYPEPYRSNILDFLFKPNFGAGFTSLKVEIGGDGNTTCGSEPAFARTREEMTNPNYQRGYEYWLMHEAQKRNNQIELSGLQWSLPGWFTDNKVWSQDNADYLVKFLDGATKEWGLNMTHIAGSRNERSFDRDWIVSVHKPNLDRHGYSYIKIVGPDGYLGKNKSIYDSLLVDEELRSTICAVSSHYSISYMHNYHELDKSVISKAINTNVPLWSGEDFSLGGNTWRNTRYLVENILRCYIDHRIVKFSIWCPVASMADNACFSNVGIMKANEPWSGYYEVWPAVWAVAHFNQFARPGWDFIDSGCGKLDGDGYYVTLKANNQSADFSIVILSGNNDQKIKIKTSNLSSNVLTVWKSDEENQFVQQNDVFPENGTFTLSLEANSIYSVTSTAGQKKGSYIIPRQEEFVRNYSDDFERYSLKEAPLTAQYLWDNSGAFEIFQSPGESKCLRQMVNNDLIHWIPDECAQTFLAQGREWEDGEISSDVFVEENAFNGVGYAGILIRGSYDKTGQARIPYGYQLNIYNDGHWKLLAKDKILASGIIDNHKWYNLKLECKQQNIKAYIDNKLVADLEDNSYPLGAVGYISGWNHSKFDNLKIKHVPVQGKLLSLYAEGKASSESSNKHESVHGLFDGNSLSVWKPGSKEMPQWATVDLGEVCAIERCETYFINTGLALKYKILYSTDNRNWKIFADRSDNRICQVPCFIDKKRVKARYIRLTVLDYEGKIPSISAFNIYQRAE